MEFASRNPPDCTAGIIPGDFCGVSSDKSSHGEGIRIATKWIQIFEIIRLFLEMIENRNICPVGSPVGVWGKEMYLGRGMAFRGIIAGDFAEIPRHFFRVEGIGEDNLHRSRICQNNLQESANGN